MNHIDARFAVKMVTIWRPEFDEFNQPTWSRIGVFPCSWTSKPTMMRDASGEQFVPIGVYYPAGEINVLRGDVVARGAFIDGAPTGVEETVRTVSVNDESYFGRGASLMFATG